jgi:hypothetical protein
MAFKGLSKAFKGLQRPFQRTSKRPSKAPFKGLDVWIKSKLLLKTVFVLAQK